MAVLVISYSRADQPQVRAVVTLLRTALRDIEKAVFWDGDFEPGDPWFEQIKGHIETAPQLFVFWCAHSAESPQVRREFTYALDRRKRVVPVLLDNTPLTDELAAIHGIDLRQAIVHAPSGPAIVFTIAPATTRLRIARALRLVPVALAGIIAFGVARLWRSDSGFSDLSATPAEIISIVGIVVAVVVAASWAWGVLKSHDRSIDRLVRRAEKIRPHTEQRVIDAFARYLN
jgi:hypothetical protein